MPCTQRLRRAVLVASFAWGCRDSEQPAGSGDRDSSNDDETNVSSNDDADSDSGAPPGDTDPPFSGLWIIDTHAHIVPRDESVNDAYIDDLVEAARDAGVQNIALGLHARQVPDRPPTFSTDHDAWVLNAAAEYPDVILPMLGGFDPEDEGSVEYVTTQLATGSWRGIGELDLRNSPKQTTTPMNHPVIMEIYALAAAYDVPVMFHFEPCYETDCASGLGELDEALTQNPDTKFICAHSCPPELVGSYPNLYCEYEVAIENLPSPEMYDYVVLGTDVQNPQLATPTGNMVDVPYGEVIALLRERLSALSDDDAERLATGNAEALFGL